MEIVRCQTDINESKLSFDTKTDVNKRNSFSHQINCIENLPNEIFHEIFEYLDSSDIYQSFSNVNTRFEKLLNSNFPIKLKFSSESDSTLQYCHHQLRIHNRHRIISLSFLNKSDVYLFYRSYKINATFTQLQALTINDITSDKLLSILKKLQHAPKLSSLVVYVKDYSRILDQVYQSLFRLQNLKYLKVSLLDDENSTSLSVDVNSSNSPIEYLYIDYPCTLTELSAIISYTPNLVCLTCSTLYEEDSNIQQELNIILPNLRKLSLKECFLPFDIFEIFIQKISSQLERLHINIFNQEEYLDADRWQKLISESLPRLDKFYFSYSHENVIPFHNAQRDYLILDQFESSFWIERQWLWDEEIDYYHTIYSIEPY